MFFLHDSSMFFVPMILISLCFFGFVYESFRLAVPAAWNMQSASFIFFEVSVGFVMLQVFDEKGIILWFSDSCFDVAWPIKPVAPVRIIFMRLF